MGSENNDVAQYIVPLSTELAPKAVKELHEKTEWRKRDVEAIRQMLKEDAELNSCQEEWFILRFLRSKKFDYENAYKCLSNYYSVKFLYPEIYQHFTSDSVQHVFEKDLLNVLDGVDYYGRKIILFKPGNLNNCDNCTLDDIIRALIMTLEVLLCTESCQVHGICILVDAANFSFSQLIHHFKPAIVKKAFHCLQGAFPCRLKAVHFVNDSHVLDAFLTLVKPFLYDKTRERMYFHGRDFVSLQQHFDQEILPSTLGGTRLESDADSATVWFENLKKHDRYFEFISKFGYHDTPTNSRHEFQQNIQQQGSLRTVFNAYRRLCIDGLNH